MPVVRGQFDQLLVPGAKKVYVDKYQSLPALYPTYFNVDTSGRAFEDDLVVTGLPIAVSKPEGLPIAFDRPKYRGKVRYIHAGYGLGYEITREAVADDQYAVLNSKGSANLARSLREAEETTAWNVFNNSFSSILTYDGVALCSDAHVGAGSVTGMANAPGSGIDLSTAALKASMERYWSLTTDRGLKITGISPQYVITSHMNYWVAQEILQTRVVTGAASSGETDSIVSLEAKNVITMLGLVPIKIQYISDTDAWWTLCSKAQHYLKFYWREKPGPESDTDKRAGIAWFAMFARWSVGATDWRGIDGSAGAS